MATQTPYIVAVLCDCMRVIFRPYWKPVVTAEAAMARVGGAAAAGPAYVLLACCTPHQVTATSPCCTPRSLIPSKPPTTTCCTPRSLIPNKPPTTTCCIHSVLSLAHSFHSAHKLSNSIKQSNRWNVTTTVNSVLPHRGLHGSFRRCCSPTQTVHPYTVMPRTAAAAQHNNTSAV
jgi:hypothetical protein